MPSSDPLTFFSHRIVCPLHFPDFPGNFFLHWYSRIFLISTSWGNPVSRYSYRAWLIDIRTGGLTASAKLNFLLRRGRTCFQKRCWKFSQFFSFVRHYLAHCPYGYSTSLPYFFAQTWQRVYWQISARYSYGDRCKHLQLGAIITFVTGPFSAKVTQGVENSLIFPYW